MRLGSIRRRCRYVFVWRLKESNDKKHAFEGTKQMCTMRLRRYWSCAHFCYCRRCWNRRGTEKSHRNDCHRASMQHTPFNFLRRFLGSLFFSSGFYFNNSVRFRAVVVLQSSDVCLLSVVFTIYPFRAYHSNDTIDFFYGPPDNR